jgi:hypothetical protein
LKSNANELSFTNDWRIRKALKRRWKRERVYVRCTTPTERPFLATTKKDRQPEYIDLR